ncbi:MAG: aminoacyl-tRNA hydrolase, partial [Duncaniella sp.]|nr:aminoacyl-tRNA hydrolase [Duncaniella sp.]
QAYPRLRFGIGNNYPRGGQIDYVLGMFTPEEAAAMGERVKVAVEAVKTFCLAGMNVAMCQFNNK